MKELMEFARGFAISSAAWVTSIALIATLIEKWDTPIVEKPEVAILLGIIGLLLKKP